MANRVEIAPYSAAWPERFAELGSSLRSALLEVAVRIDHIGSTAVPSLGAKPVIDVQISIWDFDPASSYQAPLEKLGFVFRANNVERTKRYFREPPGTPRRDVIDGVVQVHR